MTIRRVAIAATVIAIAAGAIAYAWFVYHPARYSVDLRPGLVVVATLVAIVAIWFVALVLWTVREFRRRDPGAGAG